jgi:sigma-E factor negative regulatory protein RseC
MTADAVVVAARAGGRVDLEFTPKLCAGCAGTCLWKRLQATRLERLSTVGEFAPGTEVSVTLPERRVLAASLLLHGLPLAAILVGAALGAAFGHSDAATLTGAVAGIAVAVAAAKPLGQRLERSTLARLVIAPKP